MVNSVSDSDTEKHGRNGIGASKERCSGDSDRSFFETDEIKKHIQKYVLPELCRCERTKNMKIESEPQKT